MAICVAALVERSGYGTVRGSSSRKGVMRFASTGRRLAAGRNIVDYSGRPTRPGLSDSARGSFFSPKKPARRWSRRTWNTRVAGVSRAGTVSLCRVPSPRCGSFSVLRSEIGTDRGPEEFETERIRLQNAMMSLVEQK